MLTFNELMVASQPRVWTRSDTTDAPPMDHTFSIQGPLTVLGTGISYAQPPLGGRSGFSIALDGASATRWGSASNVLGAPTSLGLLAAFSTTAAADQTLIASMRGGNQFDWLVRADGRLELRLYDNNAASATHVITSTGAYNDGSDHLAFALWDGTQIRLFIDGTEDATAVAAVLVMAAKTSVEPHIGVCRTGTSTYVRYFTGNLDDVAVWVNPTVPSTSMYGLLFNRWVTGDTEITFTAVDWLADTEFSGSYTADSAGDGLFTSAAGERWSSTTTALPHWIQRDEGEPLVAEWYRVDPGRAGSDPTAWELRASNDATMATYDVLDSQTAQSFADSMTKAFLLLNTTAHRYHRLHITGSQIAGTSIGEFEVGSGDPPAVVHEHQPPSTYSSGNFTTGQTFVVNESIDVTHFVFTVGSTAGTWEGRIRDSSGTVVLSASYYFNGVGGGQREIPVEHVTLPPGVYSQEQYGGGNRYSVRSGTNHPTSVSYGRNAEVTIPQNGTVNYRGSTNTSRQSAGNTEPVSALGLQAQHGFKFIPTPPLVSVSGLVLGNTEVLALHVGTAEATRAYLGDTLVFGS